jgi:hypothetical protein
MIKKAPAKKQGTFVKEENRVYRFTTLLTFFFAGGLVLAAVLGAAGVPRAGWLPEGRVPGG